jgi:hypothetical protein
MSEQIALDRRYMISIYEPNETDGTLIFSFAPKGLMHERGAGGSPKRVPRFIVAVRQQADGLAFDWSGTQDDPGVERGEMEAEIPARMKDRAIWIDRINALVGKVEQWAGELGWSTRRLEKRIDDLRIGKHVVPALLMQEGICRIMLEPVARSIPGTEGVVDLYLMPAYDDIAGLYYYGDRWNLQYKSDDTKPAAALSEAEAMPLSKQTLEKVLAELTKHAA